MGYLVSYYNIVFAFVNIILICICFATGLKQCLCFWISICIIFLSINCFYYLCKYCKYKEIDINMNQKEDDNNNNINNKQNHETN